MNGSRANSANFFRASFERANLADADLSKSNCYEVEFLEASLSEGPQVVTKRGVDTAVLVPISQWRRLKELSKPNLKELLLTSDARTDRLVPERAPHKHRAVPDFE